MSCKPNFRPHRNAVLPDLVGKPCEEAVKALTFMGLKPVVMTPGIFTTCEINMRRAKIYEDDGIVTDVILG